APRIVACHLDDAAIGKKRCLHVTTCSGLCVRIHRPSDCRKDAGAGKGAWAFRFAGDDARSGLPHLANPALVPANLGSGPACLKGSRAAAMEPCPWPRPTT